MSAGGIVEFLLAAGSRAFQDRGMELRLLDGLPYEDRSIIVNSRKTGQRYFQTGSLLGLCLGGWYAFLTIRRRGLAFRHLRSMQGTGTTVRFADGREELITDIAPAVRPSFFKNAFTFGALSFAGYTLGGITGGMYARKVSREALQKNPDSLQRIQAWQRQCLIIMLRELLKNSEELDAEISEKQGRNSESKGFDSWPPPDSPPPEFPRSF